MSFSRRNALETGHFIFNDVQALEIKFAESRWSLPGKNVGVPKHSDLEPPHLWAKGRWKPCGKMRPMALKPHKLVVLVCVIISPKVD